MRVVADAAKAWHEPYVSQRHVTADPFHTLVACILSLRTKDAVTAAAAERLFAVAKTPAELRALGAARIA